MVGITGLEIQPPQLPEKRYTVYYEPLEVIEREIADGINVSINLKGKIKDSFFAREVSIKEEVEIKIEALKDKPFRYYKDMIDKIQGFLAFALTKPTYPTSIEGGTEKYKRDLKGKTYYPPVGIYYRIPNIINSKEILPDEMLFTFKDISNCFETVLSSWIKIAELEEFKPQIYWEVYQKSIKEKLARVGNRGICESRQWKKIKNLLIQT